MKLNCLIVEDEPLARNLLKDYVGKVSFLNLVGETSNPLEAIEILNNNQIDLLLLDIQMPEITGMTLLKVLQKKPYVILTTAYSEYALESYELDVIDYLLKPITFDRFLKAVNKVSQRIQNEIESPAKEAMASEVNSSFFFVKDGTKLVKVVFDDLLYVEGLKDYIILHTTTKKIVTLQRIKNIELQLPSHQFIRIHNSFIVSLDAIESIYKEKVQIGKVEIPISDSYKKSFKEFIARYSKSNFDS
jgi:two-component system, LytTR family, response regulator